MNRKQMMRMTVDCLMTVILILLMGYSRVGEAAHEWLGIAMFTLFVVHHILNRKWILALFQGKYTIFRGFQTVLVILLFVGMIGSAVSGVILSKHVFSFFDLGGAAQAREIHMLCGYWNFVLMSLHLGLHWTMTVKMISRKLPKDRTALTWAARILAALIAGYGVSAWIAHRLHEYLFGMTKFAFIDFDEPLLLFLFDYLAIMGLFVFAAHYASAGMRKLSGRRKLRHSGDQSTKSGE